RSGGPLPPTRAKISALPVFTRCSLVLGMRPDIGFHSTSSIFGQRIDLLLARYVTQFMRAETWKIAARRAHEILGHDDVEIMLLADLEQRAGMVDCGPDGGEIEPRSAADIAIGDLTDIERQAELEKRPAGLGALRIEDRYAPPCIKSRRD